MNFIRGIRNLYHRLFEGAERYSERRGYLPWPQPQDARFDVNSVDRTELVRKSRGFYANNAIVNRLVDLFEQFTVGPNGLQLIPDSADEDWNSKATVRFDGWCRFPDLTSRLHFSTIQSICACVWFVDGEVFILKTYGDEVEQGGRVVRRPRVQLIEGHRVGTPDGLAAEGKNIHDGVEVDKRGRPVAYWVRDAAVDASFAFQQETYRRIPADQIIHIFEPSRPGQYRGMPFLSAVMNDLQDLDELQSFAKSKAKENAAITRVLETAAGEFPSQPSLMRELVEGNTEKSDGTDTTDERTRFVQRIFGPRALAIKSGEELKEFLNSTPTVADQQLWSILTSRICIGTGIPKILVFPESVQGTVARGDFDVANAFFRARSTVLSAKFAEVYEFVMGWEVQNTRDVSDPPDNWRNVFVCPPRAVNVDVGYNAAALLSALESGTTTYREIYAMLGKHWRVELRQRAREEAYIDRIAIEEKTTPDRIRQSIAESLKLAAMQESADKAKEDEEFAGK
jgi:capsid protein